METFSKFLYEFLKQFFSGAITVIRAIGTGLQQTFDMKSYQDILNTYKNDFHPVIFAYPFPVHIFF